MREHAQPRGQHHADLSLAELRPQLASFEAYIVHNQPVEENCTIRYGGD